MRADHFNDGAHLRRCADGSYWTYRTTHWKETTDSSLRRLLLEEANKNLPVDGASLTTLVGQAKTLLDDMMGTDDDVMGFNDDPSPVVNCANGEVWIEPDGTIDLRPHKPESRLTYCLPIKYDPKATCPIYDITLLQIFAKADDRQDMVRHWNEFVGYAIQPRRDIAAFWLMIGDGSNGKSKLLQTIQNLVGPDAVLNDQIASFRRDRFNTAALAGKLLLIDDDLPEEIVLDDGLLKRISEAKEISARHAYGRRKFKFRCLGIPIMAGNSYPCTSDVSHGLVRRAQVIPFNRVFDSDEADPSLFYKIWEDEMPGVLNRVLEGLKRLRIRKDFKLPADCVRAHHDFFSHANPLIAFLEEKCAVDPDARTKLKDFRNAMKVWARDQGVRNPPTDKRLKRKLQSLRYKVVKVKGYETLYGVELQE